MAPPTHVSRIQTRPPNLASTETRGGASKAPPEAGWKQWDLAKARALVAELGSHECTPDGCEKMQLEAGVLGCLCLDLSPRLPTPRSKHLILHARVDESEV